MMKKQYECIVIGGGHAGVEAALAAARMGAKTLMLTLSKETIGQMSCNPAIGGVGKGQMVREIDCLGGEMGLAADRTGIQFRQLNGSKGRAVRSSRCQSDRKRYRQYMRDIVCAQEGLDIYEGMASRIKVERGRVTGVITEEGTVLATKSIVIAAGTFLKGRMHIGPQITEGGRVSEPASVTLTDQLEDLGFDIQYFKTGTPPRLDGKTIDFARLERQDSDCPPVPFSMRTPGIPTSLKLLPCYITQTNQTTHRIIEDNMHLSPMYSGQIHATGVRYCPSIEDKLKKFSGKGSHQVFLEPEGLDTDLFYPNGISTGLPADVQEAFVHTIQGCEQVKITQYGYSIEHAVVTPTQLKPFLETKAIAGLFLAGQMNGSTGYEEAGAQGLMAGINAVLSVRQEAPFILRRDEAYTGVLIDDLVTKGTEEPYRMFTSRVEYRLLVREDNTDRRLVHHAYRLGLLPEEIYNRVQRKMDLIDVEIKRLNSVRVYPKSAIDVALQKRGSAALRQPALLSDILKRPEADYELLLADENMPKDLSDDVVDQIVYEVKYEGFIARQKKDVQRFQHIENIKIPPALKYDDVHGLSIEIRQKLKTASPENLGQANRISGVTPAAVSVLMVYLHKWHHQKRQAVEKNRDFQ